MSNLKKQSITDNIYVEQFDVSLEIECIIDFSKKQTQAIQVVFPKLFYSFANNDETELQGLMLEMIDKAKQLAITGLSIYHETLLRIREEEMKASGQTNIFDMIDSVEEKDGATVFTITAK